MSYLEAVHPANAANKHTPFIAVEKNTVTVRCGEKDMHPSTAEHYIGEIKVYGLKDKLLLELGSAHFYPGLSMPVAQFEINDITQYSKIVATSYCNLHGIFNNEFALKWNFYFN